MIFLIDASVYVFRAYHSVLPEMRDRDGNPVHAVFGFARFLGDLIERMRPKYIAVAFDQRRANSYPQSHLSALQGQPRTARPRIWCCSSSAVANCAGIWASSVFVEPEYEADDIIGTLAACMRDEGMRSAFITRDKDLAQLMRDGRSVLGFRGA